MGAVAAFLKAWMAAIETRGSLFGNDSGRGRRGAMRVARRVAIEAHQARPLGSRLARTGRSPFGAPSERWSDGPMARVDFAPGLRGGPNDQLDMSGVG